MQLYFMRLYVNFKKNDIDCRINQDDSPRSPITLKAHMKEDLSTEILRKLDKSNVNMCRTFYQQGVDPVFLWKLGSLDSKSGFYGPDNLGHQKKMCCKSIVIKALGRIIILYIFYVFFGQNKFHSYYTLKRLQR